MEKSEWDRVSRNYYKEVLSPFERGVKNPIFDTIRNLPLSYKRSVIDLGCGLGVLEKFLSREFREVVAVDYSREMIERASQLKLKNVGFLVADIRELRRFYSKFDVAIAVNSFLGPSLKDVDKMFSEAYKVLKANGWFIAVFPAAETELFDAFLTYKNLVGSHSDNEVMRIVREKIGSDYDLLTGVLKSGGQKHYYRFEIMHRLKEAGFRDVKVSKVEYPARQYGIDKDVYVWDWFCWCRK